MRQVFTSPRIENVDRVVELLNSAGIATHVGNRSVYQGSNFKRFSYSARVDSSAWPQVWVVRSDDQVQARALLREAGLEPATRFSAELALERSAVAKKPLVAKFSYVRVLLLIGLGVATVVAALRMSGAG